MCVHKHANTHRGKKRTSDTLELGYRLLCSPQQFGDGNFFFLKFRSLQKYQELLIPEPSLLYFKFEILFISFAFVPHSPPIGPVSKASLPPIFRVSDLDSLVEKRTPLLYYGL